jgi:hypothetical protein
MKKIVFLSILGFSVFSMTSFKDKTKITANVYVEKLDIKIKNDTDNSVKVINAGSGGSYSLTKGATTTLKMENGDKLHYYDNGKKGALILVASQEMNGKVQLLSKL